MDGSTINSMPTSRENLQEQASAEFSAVQSLQPGFYWRTKHDTEVHLNSRWRSGNITLPGGMVLLLVDIELFDGVEHTVVIQEHPTQGDGELRVLINDFLSDFEPEPDGEAVREREMAEIHASIADLQDEMQRGQTDPTMMAQAIEAGLAEWRREVEKKDQAQGDGAAPDAPASLPMLAGGQFRTDIGFVLEQRLTQSDTRAMQLIAEREAKVAEIKATWLQQRTEAISQAFERLKPFFAEKAAVALARTRNVRKQAESIMRGVASLDLYTGKGVEVEAVCTGASAPAAEPLTLMQAKRYMDEELAVWAPVGEHFDFSSQEVFLETLAREPSLRDQLLPTPRCVVSMAVRRRDIDYGDPYRNVEFNARNRRVFLLVRDGENVHIVTSGAPSHEVAARLFPTRDEYDNIFMGSDGSHITYRDIEFTRRATAAVQLILHYRRFLILLCGLDHRLKLFGDFYPAELFARFITLEFQNRYMRFVADDEQDRLLAENRPEVMEWMRQHNARVQSGSRVLCYYPLLLQPDNAPSCRQRQRDSIEIMAEPEGDSAVLIAHREKHAICVSVPVERKSWHEITQTHFNARVELNHPRLDQSRPGFLCLDAVEADDLEWYIHNRHARVRHIRFIQLFKACAAQLRQEREEERATRDYLVRSLREAGVAEDGEADALVTEGCRRWRVSHRGASLPAVTDSDAMVGLLGLLHSLSGPRTDRLIAQAEAYIEEKGVAPLKLSLDGKNRLVLYSVAPPPEGGDVLVPWRWVQRTILKPLKTKVSPGSSRYVWLRQAEESSETVLKAWPGLCEWLNDHPAPCSFAQQRQAVKLVDRSCEEALSLFQGVGQGIPEPWFTRLMRKMQAVRLRGDGYVHNAWLHVPVAAYAPAGLKRPQGVYYVIAEMRAEHALYLFGDEGQRARVKEAFFSVYAHPEKRLHHFENMSLGYGVGQAAEHEGGLAISRYDVAVYSDVLNDAMREREPGSCMVTKQRSFDAFLSEWERQMEAPTEPNNSHLDRAYIRADAARELITRVGSSFT